MNPDVEGSNLPTGHDVATLPPPRRRRPDLATLTDVRREMGKVYREMRMKKIDCQDGTRMTYVLEKIGKLIESSDLQERIEKLEAALAAGVK